jgi:hypothetical protein
MLLFSHDNYLCDCWDGIVIAYKYLVTWTFCKKANYDVYFLLFIVTVVTNNQYNNFFSLAGKGSKCLNLAVSKIYLFPTGCDSYGPISLWLINNTAAYECLFHHINFHEELGCFALLFLLTDMYKRKFLYTWQNIFWHIQNPHEQAVSTIPVSTL